MPSSKRREAVKGKPGIYRSISAQGKPRFEIFWRDRDGNPHWRRIEGGIRAAEAARADILARKGRGEAVAPIRNLTFDKAADRWWEAQASTLRPATQSAYKASLKRLRKEWGSRKLDNLDVNAVAELIRAMQAEGRKAWTIKGALTVAGRVFDYAGRRLGWAGQNPVRLLDRGERPSSDQRERHVFTRAELGALIEAAEDDYAPIFATAAATGMRLGEALGLRWRSIDFDAGTVSIVGQLDRDGNYSEPKTKRSRRVVELPAAVLSSLRELKLASPDSSDDAYVFVSKTGSPLDHRNVGGRVLRRALKNAVDAEGKPVWPILSETDDKDKPVPVPTGELPTFHALRHTFASIWIAEGGDLVELSSHLGHSNPAITASTYSHEFERAARSDARRKRIESMFGDALETSVETNGDSNGQDAATADPRKPASVHQIATRRNSRQ